MTREIFRLQLTEPEIWAALRILNLRISDKSPFSDLTKAGATLNDTIESGKKALSAKELLIDSRLNHFLSSILELLCSPDEVSMIAERGPLGSRHRKFYGTGDVFVEHTAKPGNIHIISFPFTRGLIIGETARTLGIEVDI